MTHLDLSWNDLGVEGGKALLDGLQAGASELALESETHACQHDEMLIALIMTVMFAVMMTMMMVDTVMVILTIMSMVTMVRSGGALVSLAEG